MPHPRFSMTAFIAASVSSLISARSFNSPPNWKAIVIRNAASSDTERPEDCAAVSSRSRSSASMRIVKVRLLRCAAGFGWPPLLRFFADFIGSPRLWWRLAVYANSRALNCKCT